MGSYIKSQEADLGAIGGAIAMSPTLPVYYDYPTTGNFGRPMFNGYYNITQTTGSPEGAKPTKTLFSFLTTARQ